MWPILFRPGLFFPISYFHACTFIYTQCSVCRTFFLSSTCSVHREGYTVNQLCLKQHNGLMLDCSKWELKARGTYCIDRRIHTFSLLHQIRFYFIFWSKTKMLCMSFVSHFPCSFEICIRKKRQKRTGRTMGCQIVSCICTHTTWKVNLFHSDHVKKPQVSRMPTTQSYILVPVLG